MAVVRISDDDTTLRDEGVTAFLASNDIEYERWTPSRPVGLGATAEEILEAYKLEIDTLKARGGYVTADVIDIVRETPNLEVMLAKFRREHWHDEDEVRFIIEGSGVFFVHPRGGKVFAIEVSPGDLIRIPRGTLHWFDLCQERRIRAIRLFQDVAGWTPQYTESGIDARHVPVCLGPSHVPSQT